ncbi:hypothetical protein [Almyronema epifaneia]|uniref:Uncharacterized protein n=1 Tax=Almyronema epifaneia S1 TaxID=2991925 RepID=A0ABW6IHE0_9CYAN
MSVEKGQLPSNLLEDSSGLIAIAALHQVSLRVHNLAVLDSADAPLAVAVEYKLWVKINHLAAGVVILSQTALGRVTSWQSSPVLLTPQTSMPFPIEICMARIPFSKDVVEPEEHHQITLFCNLATGLVIGSGVVAHLGDRIFYRDFWAAKAAPAGIWFSILA